MPKLQDLKKSLWEKLENEKDERLKAQILEKFTEIFNYGALEQSADQIEGKICKMIDTNKNLGEQVEIKESEKTEYEEGDLKASIEIAKQLERDEPKIQEDLEKKKQQLYGIFSQAETVITQLLKYKDKLKELPEILETELKDAQKTLDNQNLTLNSIKQEIKECHVQEDSSMAKITRIEMEINNVLAKSEELTNLINVEKTLAEKVLQYEEQIISDIEKEIEKVNMDIVDAENNFKEKNEINNNLTIIYSNLSRKLRDEQARDKFLHAKLQNISKLKNDIIHKKISSLTFDEDPNLKKLRLSMDFKKQKEKMRKLTADKAKISKDAQAAKDQKDESDKILEKLKEEKKNDAELMQIKADEIMALDKNIDDMEVEYDTLNDEKLNMIKAIEAYEMKKEFIKSNIHELTATYRDINKKWHSSVKKFRDSDLKPLNESQVKKIDEKTSVNNNKNNVHKWLNDLPPEFTKDSSRSDVLSQSSTIAHEDSNLNFQISTLGQVQSKNSTLDKDLFDLEIEDPEVIDANVSY